MTNSKSPTDKKDSFNWREIFLRAVIPGILLAIAGFISEWVITSSSSKAENARLVTDLQIQREQAESDLRKDIFSKAVEALIGDTDQQNKIADHSKRILKLELLALNPLHPSLRLHKLKGRLSDLYSVSINISYRITIEFLIEGKAIVPVNIGSHNDGK